MWVFICKMTSSNSQCFWGLLLLLSLFHVHSLSSTTHVYIVYLGRKFHDDPKLTSDHHLQLLSNVFSSEEDAKRSMLYSYNNSFSGFSALLNSSQACLLAKRKEVISVFESKMLKSHTTRSWDFLGLTLTTINATHDQTAITPLQLAYGHDIIVGIIDSGIWPESASFKEEPGMKPIPSTWRGTCMEGEMFNPQQHCSRKLIGARYYVKGFEAQYGPISQQRNANVSEYRSARDFAGHGTHTTSISVGSVANGASFMEEGGGKLATGVARGGAPRARVAVYKACWWDWDNRDTICYEADVMKAFDDALNDGVHVISASIGSSLPMKELFNSTTAISSFHAMQMGVSVVFGAGNDGPDASSVVNVMPWAICVAASTIDRTYPTRIMVEGNFSVVGESFSFISKTMTANLAISNDYFKAGICRLDRVRKRSQWPKIVNAGNNTKVILLCMSVAGPVSIGDALLAAMNISASAVIFAEPIPRLQGPDPFPIIRLRFQHALHLKNHRLLYQTLPMVQIGPTKSVVGKSVAPKVVYFSSRGPNSIEPDILKPDITAPGMNILAAWPTKTPPSIDVKIVVDKRSVEWNFQSGTSMSCPHVSGIVALLKSAHPHWSPAAIKSALMTTASRRDNSLDDIISDEEEKVSDPFDMGAGHVDPLKAMDPGLVYDMKTSDYVLFLCNLGYSRQQIERLILPSLCPDQVAVACPKVRTSNSKLNYPAIVVSDLQSAVTVERTVRNVGPNKLAVYYGRVVEPNGVNVVLWPRVLVFWWFREEITYSVTLTPKKESQGRFDFGEIVWTNILGNHKLRSPLVVRLNTIATTSSATAHHPLLLAKT